MSNQVKYSWIMPIKNEALSLPQLLEEIKLVMTGKSFEVIAINDASSDNSLSILKKLTKKHPFLKIIHSKTHLGKWVSLEKGFIRSSGQVIITIDSDLQDDPSQVHKLLKSLTLDNDIVSGCRKNRQDFLLKIWLSKLGNILASRIFNLKFKDLNSSFKVYKRGAFLVIPKTGTLFRFSLLFAKLMGFKIAEVAVTHRKRLYGKSKFGLVKYVRILYDLILIRLLFLGSGRLTKVKKIPKM